MHGEKPSKPVGFDPIAFLERVGSGKTIRHYAKGEIIFKQDEPADVVYYLQSGRVKESIVSHGGREAVVGILEPHQFFGTSGLDGGSRRTSTMSAVLSSTVTAITNDEMLKVLAQEPKFSQLFVAYLLHHNSQTEAEKVDLLFNKTEKRLAQKLLVLAHFGTNGQPQKIGPEITQEMLADMIGTTRPHVNRFLNRFRKLGFIKYNGGITVMGSLLTALMQDGLSLSGETDAEGR